MDFNTTSLVWVRATAAAAAEAAEVEDCGCRAREAVMASWSWRSKAKSRSESTALAAMSSQRCAAAIAWRSSASESNPKWNDAVGADIGIRLNENFVF